MIRAPRLEVFGLPKMPFFQMSLMYSLFGKDITGIEWLFEFRCIWLIFVLDRISGYLRRIDQVMK